MEFFDWSKGYVYLGIYVNIVPVDPENDVIQSHCGPVDSNPAISPEVRVVAPRFCYCISGARNGIQ